MVILLASLPLLSETCHDSHGSRRRVASREKRRKGIKAKFRGQAGLGAVTCSTHEMAFQIPPSPHPPGPFGLAPKMCLLQAAFAHMPRAGALSFEVLQVSGAGGGGCL